jgi:hypothetical protein
MNTLKQKAIALGLCADFQKSWSDDLVGMYKRGISWCMKHKYPSLADMLPYDKELADNDVYNSRLLNLILTNDTYILNDCKGEIEIDDFNVSGLYVALNSIVDINVKDSSILTIECYDNAILRVSVDENAVCSIWKYGNSVIQVLKGNVKIIQK